MIRSVGSEQRSRDFEIIKCVLGQILFDHVNSIAIINWLSAAQIIDLARLIAVSQTHIELEVLRSEQFRLNQRFKTPAFARSDIERNSRDGLPGRWRILECDNRIFCGLFIIRELGRIIGKQFCFKTDLELFDPLRLDLGISDLR